MTGDHAQAIGAGRMVVCSGDVCEPATWWDGEPFQAVVLDVPCSASGLLRTKPEVKFHQDQDSVGALQAVQLRMLRTLWPMIRPGGELLYTTCSILAAENEDVIRAFLADQGNEATATKLAAPLAQDAAGAGSIAARACSPAGLVFYPSQSHQGGFVALLRKGQPSHRAQRRPDVATPRLRAQSSRKRK